MILLPDLKKINERYEMFTNFTDASEGEGEFTFSAKDNLTSYDFETCAILGWSTASAQARMDNLLAGFYTDGSFPALVLSPNDSLAMGITNSLQAAGCAKENFPIITGQDCDKPNTRNIIDGWQAMSVFKDTRTLAAKVVEMVNAYLLGDEVPVNDTETYNNGVKNVPSFLCDPVFADVNNYAELLIDSGYYTPADLGL